jgi:O-antigen/teichoic acid export membrane protein
MNEPLKEKAEKAEKLVKNSIWLFSAEGASKVIALGIQVIAARFLGGEGYGIFSFAFAATGAFIVFIDAGIGIFLTREVSRHPENAGSYLRNVFALKWKLSLATCLVLAGALSMADLERASILSALAIGLALMVNGYTEMHLAVFRAFERMKIVSVLLIAQRVLFFILGLTVLLQGGDVVVFSFAFLLSAIVILVVASRQWVLEKEKLPASTLDRQLAREIFHKALPLCGLLLFTYIYFRIDAVLLFFLRGKLETGLYSAAFKLIENISLLIASIRLGVFPVLSRTFKEGSDHYQKIWTQSVRYLLLISIPLSVGMLTLAPRILGLLFGTSFEAGGTVLMILSLGFPLLCLNDLTAYLLLSQNKTHSVLKITGGVALFNLLLNFMLIPKWGMEGAAGVATLTQFLLFGVYYFKVREICGSATLLPLLWRPALAAGTMALLLVGWDTLALIPAIFLGVGVYCAVLLALKTFNEFDSLIFRRVVKRK